MKRLLIPVLLFVTLSLLCSCGSMATQTKQYSGLPELLARRDFAAAVRQVESMKDKAYGDKDRVLYYLDMGFLLHYNREYARSNEYLQLAEEAIEDLYTKSISKGGASVLLNDNALDYSGESYEDVYCNVFKALNYLHLNDTQSARVEIRRIGEKLDFLQDKYGTLAQQYNDAKESKQSFKPGDNLFRNSALGRYLGSALFASEGRRDESRIDYEQFLAAFTEQPAVYTFSPPPVQNHSQHRGMPLLHLLALAGTSPYKRQREMHIMTAKDYVSIVAADKSVAAVTMYWEGMAPNYYFKFAQPYLVNDPSAVHKVVAVVNGRERHELGKIEDIGTVAQLTYAVREPMILLKSAARSISKGIAAASAKAKMQAKNPGWGGALMGLGTDLMVSASENADLRSSRLLPNDVFCADIALPEGTHQICIEYYDSRNALLYRDSYPSVSIGTNRMNLLESWHLK